MQNITVENEELPEKANTNQQQYDDPEIKKLDEVINLIRSLFTENPDKEVEISDLDSIDISAISQLKFFDEVLGFPLFHNMSKGYMRLSFSKNRKSREEIITAIKSLVSDGESEPQNIETKSRLRQWIDRQ